MRPRYPGYDVLAKWDTLSFNDATRQALAERLALGGRPRFFAAAEFRLLQAVSDRLIPQPDRDVPIPLAHLIDEFFAAGREGGYWIDGMPRLPDAWRQGLAAIDAEAKARFRAGFAKLPSERQDAVLKAVEAGEVETETWGELDAAQFFRNTLLKLTAGLYYAHPAAWSEIGFGGPASPRGYVRLGLDDRDPWEAKEHRP